MKKKKTIKILPQNSIEYFYDVQYLEWYMLTFGVYVAHVAQGYSFSINGSHRIVSYSLFLLINFSQNISISIESVNRTEEYLHNYIS